MLQSKHKLYISLLLSFFLLFLQISFFNLPSFAQDDLSLELDTVVISARGYATPIADIPGGIAIASRDELNRTSRHGSIADALDMFPGIARTGESPYAQDISIRGLSGPSIVILVNGKRINTATDINARLGYINPADVERVEVLKGPLSALYGSGSTGGVINIITKKPTDFSTEGEISGEVTLTGSTNPQGGLTYGYLAFSSAKVAASASVAYRKYASTYGFDRNLVPNSQFQDLSGRASLSFKASENLILTTEFIKSFPHNVGIPGGNTAMPNIASIVYPNGAFTMISEDLSLNIESNYLKKVEADFYYTSNRRRVHISNVGAVPPPQPQPIDLWPKANHDTFGGKISSTWNIGSNTLVAGGDFWTWKVDSERLRIVRLNNTDYTSLDHPTPKSEQVSIGVFASDTYEISPNFSLYLGGRLDRLRTENEALYFVNPINLAERLLFDAQSSTDIGWQLHLGATYRQNEYLTHNFLISSAYRAADIMERFKYINLAGMYELFGNPNLDPERGIFAEYELNYDSSSLNLGFSVFANFIEDYIAERAETPSLRRLYNIASARIYGTELSASYLFPYDIKLSGSLTYLYGEDRANAQPLGGVAPFNALLSLEYQPDNGFWAKLTHRYIAPQTRTPALVPHSKNANITSLSLGYLNRGKVTHDISISIDNIFDQEYKNYLANERGYTIWEPGISASINYTFSF